MPDHNAAMQQEAEGRTDTAVSEGFAAAIVHHRHIYFITIAVFFALAFNGVWKVGHDSALNRGLARSIAEGTGYEFGPFASSTIYPGFPLLLAGFYKLVGENTLVPQLAIYLMAGLALLLTYKLIALRYPTWIATAVTALVGINAWLLSLANELLADVPFFLALVASLYTWELLRDATSTRQRATAGAWLVVSLAAAALLRPTFWILVLAWLLLCAWRVVRGPRRGLHAVMIAVIALVAVTFVLLDPRTSGLRILEGGYERMALDNLRDAADIVGANTWQLLTRELSMAFFGGRFTLPLDPWMFGPIPRSISNPIIDILAPVVTVILTLALIVSSILLWRRQPLWTLLILLTIGVTLVWTTVGRYYVMVMPLLVLSWILLLLEIAKRLPRQHRDAVVLCGMLLVVVPNLIRCGREVGNQRFRDVGKVRDWGDVLELAREMPNVVPEDALVLADESAPVLRYLTRREVVMHRDVLPRDARVHDYPAHLASLGIDFALFPSDRYGEGGQVIGEMMDREVIIPLERVWRTSGLVLAAVQIDVPAGDWRRQPITTLAREGVLHQQTAEERAAAQAKAERLEREERAERHRRQAAQAAREARIAKAKKAAKLRKQQAAIMAQQQQQQQQQRQQSPTTRPGDVSDTPVTSVVTPDVDSGG